MSFKSIFRELREMKDGRGNISRRCSDRKHGVRPGRAHIAPEGILSPCDSVEQGQWANLLPELLCDIIQRVEASETSWPARRDVVACASVCRSWREITKQTVMTPEKCGLLTFPISLKQPGPRDSPIQCFIRRERATATYRLYLGLSPALSGDMSKLILVAKKVRRAMGTDFLISLCGDDFSRSSNMYIGKLRANFLGTKFTIHDSRPPSDSPMQLSVQPHQKSLLRQATPRNPDSSPTIGCISYELNVLRTRGPRRMHCFMLGIPSSAIHEGGAAPTPVEFTTSISQALRSLSEPKEKKPLTDMSPTCLMENVESVHSARSPLILKNKAPRWHDQLQCWCLNFKGRVTVASVKNFQLVAAVEPGQNVPTPTAEQEKVILQFGKIGKDIFTMDYRYPLSAFQAFAICLSSFDTKPACE